jgi:signal transduction histidine kinase
MNPTPGVTPPLPPLAAGQAGRVLVVDDTAVSRLLLSRWAANLGCSVETAADGRQALDLLRARPFDLVLLDIEMPEMDGHAVLEHMKADPALRALPVIVVSGADGLGSIVRAISEGAEDFLPKPFDPVLLKARIGACLEKKRLRDEERRKTEELEKALRQLRATQAQLLVQEKMASLGALTAGIAHEIKNPLNFVTNFAQLSVDLVAELREELTRAAAAPPAEVEDLLATLEQNLSKVREHGQRADSIVCGMLLHARGGKGERRPTDLNALVEQTLTLAYHGQRARDASVNITLQRDYNPAAGEVCVVAQDLSRALLNIMGNGIYAARERQKSAGAGFTPTLAVRTRDLGDRVEVRIRDNGGGVPVAVRERIFQPFFTTKPTGVGTGLGLSICYDIIVHGHGGELRLDTEEGSHAEFILTLPRGAPGEPGA